MEESKGRWRRELLTTASTTQSARRSSFKATPHRVVGPGGQVRIRRDSKWNVPEPELALVVNSRGKIIGYTIGNDMSSRDNRGGEPALPPQAKVYDGCCGLGPCVLVADAPPSKETAIAIEIKRGGAVAFFRRDDALADQAGL
jgi:2-dehydro-3-deoxy-D-arabinonate dehydratase